MDEKDAGLEVNYQEKDSIAEVALKMMTKVNSL